MSRSNFYRKQKRYYIEVVNIDEKLQTVTFNVKKSKAPKAGNGFENIKVNMPIWGWETDTQYTVPMKGNNDENH